MSTHLDPDDTLSRIKEGAFRHVRDRGALTLSPDAVAEALGEEAAELRRHVADRDALLTLLVVDAYDGMGDYAERAVRASAESGATPLERWVAVCRAIRDWAMENPHKYELIYGTNVPGYDAPPETMVAGARTATALIEVLRDASERGALEVGDAEKPPRPVQAAVEGLVDGMAAGLPEPVVTRLLVAWTQLFGMVGFSVFGHIVAFGEDPGAFVQHAARVTGRFVGITR